VVCGGAAKTPGVVFFCHLCMWTSDNISVPDQIQCRTCLQNGRVFVIIMT
jgi:hypothetical protein